jgi:hypothetical protein
MNGSWSRKKIARGEAVPVEFTLEQRDLILGRHQGNIPLAPLVDEETFRAALVKEESVIVKMDLDDIEHLLDFVAGDANHTRNRQLKRQLEELCRVLDRVFHSYLKI